MLLRAGRPTDRPYSLPRPVFVRRARIATKFGQNSLKNLLRTADARRGIEREPHVKWTRAYRRAHTHRFREEGREGRGRDDEDWTPDGGLSKSYYNSSRV